MSEVLEVQFVNSNDITNDDMGEVIMQMVQEQFKQAISEDGQGNLVDVNVLILLISRLAQVLGREVDMLEGMNIKGLATLQHEKLALVDALEKQKKLIARRPSILNELSDDMRDNLAELLHIFDAVAHENHNRLLVAKEVNQLVVDAIMDTTHENLRQGLYNEKGNHAEEKAMALSLNRTI
jgi:hypothetical protein